MRLVTLSGAWRLVPCSRAHLLTCSRARGLVPCSRGASVALVPCSRARCGALVLACSLCAARHHSFQGQEEHAAPRLHHARLRQPLPRPHPRPQRANTERRQGRQRRGGGLGRTRCVGCAARRAYGAAPLPSHPRPYSPSPTLAHPSPSDLIRSVLIWSQVRPPRRRPTSLRMSKSSSSATRCAPATRSRRLREPPRCAPLPLVGSPRVSAVGTARDGGAYVACAWCGSASLCRSCSSPPPISASSKRASPSPSCRRATRACPRCVLLDAITSHLVSSRLIPSHPISSLVSEVRDVLRQHRPVLRLTTLPLDDAADA
jgi:hypothetical protein